MDWLCFPRFDSSPVFARLLDDRAGHFLIRPADAGATATRCYLPQSLMLETTWTCAGGVLVVLDAMALGEQERGHDLGRSSPGVLLRTARCTVGTIEVLWEYAPRPEFGLVYPQLHAVDGGVVSSGGATVLVLSTDAPLTVEGSTATGTAVLTVGEQLTSALQQADAWEPLPAWWTAERVRQRMSETGKGWQSWSDLHQRHEGPLRALVHHSGVVLQGLSYARSGALVAAATTSLPEGVGSGRTWDYRFSWVRDATGTGSARRRRTIPTLRDSNGGTRSMNEPGSASVDGPGGDDRPGRPPAPADLPPPAPSAITPQAVRSFRSELTVGKEVVDPTTWAGSVPQAQGIAPRLRVSRNRWFNLLWLLPIGFFVLIVAVAAAKGLRNTPTVERFIHRYPGTVVSAAARRHPGFPFWVGVTHFLNLFLLIFIIRSGLQILSDHPRLYWTRHSTPGKDWFRIQKPVPENPLWTAKKDSISLPAHVGLPGIRHSIGLARWWHLGTDILWLLNGLVFYVLLFTTGQWRHLVPTSWEVVPNAASVAIQYLSLNWPTDSGWVAYNSLQLVAYFVTVFVAAPLALVTGLGMSPALSTRFKPVSKVLSIQLARSTHFLVLVWFLVFIVAHVTFVFTTGLLRNLNHVYAARDENSWTGFAIFAVSMVVVVVGWVAATPFTLRHPRVVQRVGYALIGPTQRLFEHLDATPGQYSEKDISPYFWHNGQYPDSPEYTALLEGNFADYRLRVNGLVEHPQELDLVQLRALPYQEQITQHFCIQGWSGIAKWGGVSMQSLLDLVQPRPEARWVVFYSLGEGPDEGIYYDAHPIEQMSYHLTMLAYDMNGEPLSFGHGAPLRLRNEIQLGFKQVKWIKGVEFVASLSDVGGGHGGYNEDHEFFGYRQTI